MKSHRIAMAAAGCAAVLLLSACGGEDGNATAATTSASPTPTSETSPTTSSTRSTSASTSASASSAEVPADATAPGSELKVGDRAVVPFKSGTDKSGVIGITVKSIEAGAKEDLASYGDKAKNMTPVYIRMTVENVGGTDLSYSSVRLRLVGPDGKGTGVIITGETPKCQSESAKKDFTTAGATYETCALQAVQDGGGIGGATYTDSATYKDKPITWKK